MEAEGCSFSLMCQEDGADLGDGFSNDDEKLLFPYDSADDNDDEEDAVEYMDHLVSKESSFCSSPESSSCFSDGAETSPSMASEDWFQCVRRATVKWILEMRGYFGFYHRTAYLAIAYFDRFCLRRCVDRSVMPWAARLLAVACVSLAAKMEEYQVPALSEFRADDAYEFSSVSIRRMELLVLSTLGWRMDAVTPFDYLPCLSSRLRRRDGGGGAPAAVKAAALIFSAAEVASVLDHLPSTVAAAAVLAATHGALTEEALISKMGNLFPPCLLDKEDVYACYTLMLRDPSSTATMKTNKRSASYPIDAASAYDSFAVAAATSNNSKRVRLDLHR